jgi:group I intron endonuclease
MTSGIYQIVNVRTGKRYIGQSENVSKRYVTHKYRLITGRHVNQHLQNAWNKYGEDAFEFRLVEECPVVALSVREQMYFNVYLESDRWDQLYNIAQDAETPSKYWEGKKRPDIAGENHYLWGKSLPESTKQKLSAAKSGRHLSEAHKEAIRKANPEFAAGFWKGKKRPNYSGENHHYYGKERKPEVREKISQSLQQYYEHHESPAKGHTKSSAEKRNLCEKVSKLTEDQVWEAHRRYSTGDFQQKDLAQMFGINSSSMHNILRGKTWKHVYRKAQDKLYTE